MLSSPTWTPVGQLNELSEISVSSSGENQANSQKTCETPDRSLYNSTNPSNLSSLSGLGECHWSNLVNPADLSPGVKQESATNTCPTNSETGRTDQACSPPSPSDLSDSVGLEHVPIESAVTNPEISPVSESGLSNLSPWWPLLLTSIPPPVSLSFQNAFLYLRFWRHLLAQLSASPISTHTSLLDGPSTCDPRLLTTEPRSFDLPNPVSWAASSPTLIAGLNDVTSNLPTQSSPLNLATKAERMCYDWSSLPEEPPKATECSKSSDSARGGRKSFSSITPYETHWESRTSNVNDVRHSTPRAMGTTKLVDRTSHTPGSGQRAIYKCSHCGRGFSKAYNRTIHERTHTDERPFGCNVCSRRFRRKDHLRDHSYTHLTSKPFVCSTCNRGFCQSRSLENHKRTNHTNSSTVLASQLLARTKSPETEPQTHVIRDILQKSVLDISLGSRDTSNHESHRQAV